MTAPRHKAALNMNVRDEFLVGTHGVHFIHQKLLALHRLQRIAAGKPWPEHEGPWGDSDGDDNGAYKPPGPGEEGSQKPSQVDGDEQYGDPDRNVASLRETCLQLSEEMQVTNPSVSMNLLQIEARLGELTMFLPSAIAGTAGAAQASLARLHAQL